MLVTDDRGGGVTIVPGPLGSAFVPQDFKSLATIVRVRHDLTAPGSFVGAVLTDRENDGGGHNRVIGPDFLWHPNEADAFSGELLISDTTSTSHALTLNYNRNKAKYDWYTDFRDFGNGFRADLGFVPQVGYREWDAGGSLHYFPEHGAIRDFHPTISVDDQQDQHGDTIQRYVAPGFGLSGVRNLQVTTFAHFDERQRAGNQLLPQNYFSWNIQIDPSRRVNRVNFNGRAGELIDFANARVGHGASLNLTATTRPIDKVTFDLTGDREWLNVGGERLYTATIERVRMVYSFSSRSLVRVIGQYVTTSRNPALYTLPVDRHSGQFLGSLLYSYKVNWQTVLFAGYGDDRVVSPNNNLLRADGSLFFKVSYAYQR
jgi:hypothetical protein